MTGCKNIPLKMNASGNLLTPDLCGGIPRLRLGWGEMARGVSPYGITVGTCIFFEVLVVLYVIYWGITQHNLFSQWSVLKKKKSFIFFLTALVPILSPHLKGDMYASS